MPRNLVICCDGTSNQFGLNKRTNVVRLVDILDRDSGDQRVYYDPGVGTLPEPGIFTWLGNQISELFGLAFGGGLLWKVQEAYTYLMNVWEPGDRVFLFGFSRGAYTVRVLAGLLHELGLLAHGDENLLPYAVRLFETALDDQSDAESDYWKLRNAFRKTFARPVKAGDDDRRFPIQFLGVWDTVSSVGWVWDPPKFPFSARNPSIQVIRHAVSVDERRWFFRQNLMRPGAPGKDHEAPPAAPKQDLLQRWFPGVHCDIGGGYSENAGQLWRVSFEWMLEEAKKAGLRTNPQREATILPPSPPPPAFWKEEIHESLTLVWWPLEFFPKLVWRRGGGFPWPSIGLGGPRIVEEGEHIHRSTLLRIKELANYRPRNFSPRFIEKVLALAEVPESLPYER